MSFYAPPDQIDQVEYAKESGVKMLEYMEGYFGIGYPLPKAGKNDNYFYNCHIRVCPSNAYGPLLFTSIF